MKRSTVQQQPGDPLSAWQVQAESMRLRIVHLEHRVEVLETRIAELEALADALPVGVESAVKVNQEKIARMAAKVIASQREGDA